MNYLHAPTAFLIVGLLFLSMPIITWSILSKQSSPTVTLWCNGGLALGLGLVLIAARAYVPAWATYPLANFLIILGSLTRVQSLRIEMKVPWQASWILIASVLAIAIFEYVRQGLDNAQLRLEYMLFVYMIVFGFTAVTTWQFNKKFNTPSAFWITGFYALLAAAMFVRIAEINSGYISRPDGIDSTAANTMVVIVGILAAVISHIAYAGMKLEQQQIKLQKAEKEYEAILQTTLDGFFVMSTSGRFVDVNSVISEWTGYTRDELLTMGVHDLEASESREQTNDHIEKVQQVGSDRFETRYRCKNGRMLDVEISVTHMPELEGQFLVFVRDITERKSFQAELERLVMARTLQLTTARAEAEAANAVKTRFMQNVSHEMRTPMHAILGYSELGKNKSLNSTDDSLVSYFEKIQVSGNRMQKLVESVLKLAEDSRNKEVGVSDDDLVVLSPKALVCQCISVMEKTAESRQQKIDLEDQSTITAIQGDELRLSQVLEHLIGNALRYSPENSTVIVRMSDRPRQYASASAGILLQVIDDGCGIPESEINAIFEPFYQSSRTATGAGGTGLGLALTKGIVENHKGTLTAANRPNGGAIFELFLPVI